MGPGVRRREGEAGAPGGGSWEGGGGASRQGLEDVPAELEVGAFEPPRTGVERWWDWSGRQIRANSNSV